VLVLASTAYDIGRVIGYLFFPIVIGGVILFIARSQSGSKRTTAAAAAPPDWYADPYRRARLRYWDGARWTEHTAD
jgi:hypothetical protein